MPPVTAKRSKQPPAAAVTAAGPAEDLHLEIPRPVAAVITTTAISSSRKGVAGNEELGMRGDMICDHRLYYAKDREETEGQT